MIKLFRRIRRKLIDEGNLKRYLLYAIGEILLVVIGILIALQVNNWNHQSNENEIEIALLQQLEKDLRNSDSNYNVEFINRGIHSAEILLDYMKTNLPYEDSLAFHFASSFSWTRLVVNSGAYETIKSHGIEIISNIELRDEIINLYEGKLYFLRQLENITMDYVENMRRVEFVQFFKSSYVDFGLRNGYDAGKSVPKDYERLKKNEEFRYHLESFLHLMNVFQNRGNRPMKKNIENLVNSIQKELDKK